MEENRGGMSPKKIGKGLEYIKYYGVTPFEHSKGGITDYESQEPIDKKRYIDFLNTSSYDEVRDVEVTYQGEEI